jgi:hypothetical protein
MDGRCINKYALSFKGNTGLMLRKQLFAFSECQGLAVVVDLEPAPCLSGRHVL